MAKKKLDLEIASVLAFEKKLVPSDGYMSGTSWNNRKKSCSPLHLQEKSVRGTISNRLKDTIKKDPAKLNAEVEKANLQTVDICSLGPDQDTLKLDFTLKILGGVQNPSACNNSAFKRSYADAADKYIKEEGFKELARRYALNIANGRFCWRNRVGAEAMEIHVQSNEQDFGKFDSFKYNTRNFNNDCSKVKKLATRIAEVLASKDNYLILDITCYAKIGRAQEVYPSEELVLDKGNGKKSKILYSYDADRKAAMHSQKLGNALRTIDTWYPDFDNPEEGTGPIAIEPYGAVTNLGKAYRTPKDKQDFYTLFDSWARGGSLDNKEDEHYVMAVLVRGGVFGQSSK